MRLKALDSIHKRHLGTDKWYQFKIKGLELILGLDLNLNLGGKIMGTCLLSRLAQVIVLIFRLGGGNLHSLLNKMVSFSDIFW